ncbi:MAG: hypothetical protein ACQEVA_10015 [Myxococcota bacterium]
MTELDREPLEESAFPAQLQKHVAPDAPTKLKMMAARGMLPAPPEQMILVLYQLSFDSDSQVQKAVREALKDMPPNVVVPAIQKTQREGVLDWIGRVRAGEPEVGEAIATNRATHDQTIAVLARNAGKNLADIIATNQVRVLRTPKIIEALYQNPEVGSATIDSLLELAQRENVELKGLPGVQQALKSGQDIFKGGDEEDDREFEDLLKQEAKRATEEEERFSKLEDEDLTRSQREQLREELESETDPDEEGGEGEGKDEKNVPMRVKIQNMSISDKIRLATVGSREAVKLLISDTNKLVHMAAIQSPRVKPADIKKFASNRALPDGVIEYIAGNRDWTQKYDVTKALVLNPKTPLRDTLKFLKHLRADDLKKVSRSRDIPHQVSRSADSLLKKRRGSR